MTFGEWYAQTHRELPSNVPKDLVKEVMVTAIRVAVEELMSNREEADLDIGGIGRFYLNHRVVHNPLSFKRKGSDEEEQAVKYSMCWTLQFTPWQPLKKVINEKMDIREMLVGGTIPLYEDYMYSADGMKKRRGRDKPIKKPKITKNYRVRFSDKYKNQLKQIEKRALKENLPDEE